MSRTAILTVKVLADSAGFQKGMGSAGRKVDGFRDSMQKAALPAAAIGGAIIGFGKKALDSASHLQQAQGGVEAVFKGGAKQMLTYGKAAAQSVGLAESEYADFATLIGSQLKNSGVPMKDLGKQTDALIRQGADLAAMYGGTTADAVAALSSGLKGEMDPLEKYGIGLSQAAVAAELAAKGQDKLKGKALTSAKAQAIMALAARQGKDATGAFAREADTVAGKQQRAAAAFENTSAALGEKLMPIMTKIIEKFSVLTDWVSKNIDTVQLIAGVVLALVAAFLTLNVVLAVTNAIMAANPWTLAIVGVLLLVGAIIVLWKKSDAFRNFFLGIWAAIQPVVMGVFNAIKSAVAQVMPYLMAAWRAFEPVAKAVWMGVRVAAEALWPILKAIGLFVGRVLGAYFRALLAVVTFVFKAVFTVAKVFFDMLMKYGPSVARAIGIAFRAFAAVARAVFNAIRATAVAVFNAVRSVAVAVFNAMRSSWNAVSSAIRSSLSAIGSLARAVWNGVRSAASGAFSAIRSAVATVKSVVMGVWSAISGAASRAFATIRSVGASAINALLGPIRAVSGAWQAVVSAVQTAIGWISRISFPSLPDWMPGGRIGSPVAPGGFAAVAASGVAPQLGTRSAAGVAASGGSGVSITVNGALDPDAVARQILALLVRQSRRRNGVAIGHQMTVGA